VSGCWLSRTEGGGDALLATRPRFALAVVLADASIWADWIGVVQDLATSRGDGGLQ
jgi:hypothetical protein